MRGDLETNAACHVDDGRDLSASRGDLMQRVRFGVLAGLALAGAVAAAPVPSYLSLEQYTPERGLSQAAVTALVEDDRGFLWIGTQEGLNRFDGHRFVVHRGDDADRPLASSSIDALAIDERSRLWVGTNDAGLEVIDLRGGPRRRLTATAGLSHDTVRQILPLADGGALLGTAAGIDRVDAAIGSVRTLAATAAVVDLLPTTDGAWALDIDCRLYRIHGDTVQALGVDLPAGARCVGLQADDQALWLATGFDGVWKLGHDARIEARFGPPGGVELTAFGRYSSQSLLLGYADGSVRQLDTTGTSDPEPVLLDRPLGGAVLRFHRLQSGVLWIGTLTSGLFRAQALSSAIERDLLSDAELAGWPTRSVRSVLVGEHDALVGTDSGLIRRRAGQGGWQRVDAIGATSIRAIVQHPDGGWWVGSHQGLWRLWPDGRARPLDPLPDPRVTDLLHDGDDLWVATRGGLARLRDDRLLVDGVVDPLHGVFLTCLMRDDLGRLWIGSNERGLFLLLPDGRLESLSTANGRLLHDSVWSLHADDDAFWVGSYSGGLQRIDRRSGALRRYTTADGLPNNVIFRILPDRSGRLWLTTNQGIGVLDPATGVIQQLGVGDGLRNREFNSGAGVVDANGILYLGGTDGLDVIDPDRLESSSAPARPVVTGVRLLGRQRGEPARDVDIGYRRRLELDHRDSFVSLDMVAIDFTAPDAARLRYRISEIHDEWVQPSGAHAELVLSHLPAGEYELEVQAAGRDGRFDHSERLALSVQPPPWRQPWAYFGYLLAVGALLAWTLLRLQVRARAERARIELLNRTVEARTAELAQANRLLQQSNAQLELAIRTDPLTQVSNRRELHEWLQRETPLVLKSTTGGDPRSLLFLMIDLDDFKRVNDQYGHQVGDEVLIIVAERLRTLCREHDIVVRWGGEEFLMLVRDAARTDPALLAERIRGAVADTPMALASGHALAVTCSIGFAQWPFSQRWPALGDWEHSVTLADRALYAAKAAGKNAWIGLAAGAAAERGCLQQLLAGGAPDELPSDCVEVLHSPGIVPVVR